MPFICWFIAASLWIAVNFMQKCSRLLLHSWGLPRMPALANYQFEGLLFNLCPLLMESSSSTGQQALPLLVL